MKAKTLTIPKQRQRKQYQQDFKYNKQSNKQIEYMC